MTDDSTYRPGLVGWLSLAQLINWGSIFYTFALLMGPVESELGLSRVEVSLAFSIAILAEGLLAYPVGRWIERGLERRVMTGGSLLAAACLALHSLVNSQLGFYAVWAGLGAAMAMVLYTPVFAVVTRRFPADYRRAIITMTFLGGLASTVFIPLSAALIAQLSWRPALLCLAALHLLVCAPLHALALRNAPAKALRAAGEATAGLTPNLRSTMRGKPFLLVAAFMVLMTAVSTALPAHMISLLRERGLSEAWVIAVPASLGAFQVLGRLFLFFFERHFDLHLANRLIPALIPLGLLVLLGAPLLAPDQSWLMLLFVLLFGVGNGMLTIVKGTAFAQYVNRDQVARLNGALGLPLALARAAAPLLLAGLWTQQAGYSYGLWLLFFAASLGVAALHRAAEKTAEHRGG
ncbi:MFS transporter [Roseateles oligotrophus]|uniref:MFS transporter n=1 Tax=Roseateles oligotrophus TaxID=1769250 RepID=A0ABT2YDU4_9BURK|nr:MFS transporter [Roseateles oligotrophus]MCV2368227.1 MFS transporter [Roseateles oligotrophus]